MDFLEVLRKLAKTNYHQTIYSSSKENNLRLFRNDIDLSDIQIKFLNLLSFYSNLYTDIALGDVDEIVLEDPIYEDAWNFYRSKRYENRKKQLAQPVQKTQDKTQSVNQTSIVFKRPKKNR